MILFLSLAFVVIGTLVLLATLVSLRRLLPVLSPGSMRSQWEGMAVLIVVFIAAFLGYIVVLWTQPAEPYLLFISSVLLLGAIAGWLMARLSLQTAVEIRQVENELVRREKLALLGQVADTVGHITPRGVRNLIPYVRQIIREGTLGKLEMVCGFLSQDWLRATKGRWRRSSAEGSPSQSRAMPITGKATNSSFGCPCRRLSA